MSCDMPGIPEDIASGNIAVCTGVSSSHNHWQGMVAAVGTVWAGLGEHPVQPLIVDSIGGVLQHGDSLGADPQQPELAKLQAPNET